MGHTLFFSDFADPDKIDSVDIVDVEEIDPPLFFFSWFRLLFRVDCWAAIFVDAAAEEEAAKDDTDNNPPPSPSPPQLILSIQYNRFLSSASLRGE